MSTTEIKLPLHHASRLANRLVELLSPHCERIDIAGSVRRGKSEVGDIELVCEPKKIGTDIFGQSEKPVLEFWAVLRPFQRIMGNVDGTGRYYKYKIPTGWDVPEYIQLDLFIPQPHDYYRQLAIRTGSANYSHRTLAAAWTRLGWVGTDDGLRRTDECRGIPTGDKYRYVCTLEAPTLPPVWLSEEEFFEWLNVTYLVPENRNL